MEASHSETEADAVKRCVMSAAAAQQNRLSSAQFCSSNLLIAFCDVERFYN